MVILLPLLKLALQVVNETSQCCKNESFFRHQKRFYYCAADDDEEPIVTGCPFVFNLFSMRNNILDGARLVHISIFFLGPSQLFNSTAPEEMLFPSYLNRLLAHQLLLKNQWRLRSSTQRKQANCKFTLSEFYGLGLEKSLEWSYRTRKELPQQEPFEAKDWNLPDSRQLSSSKKRSKQMKENIFWCKLSRKRNKKKNWIIYF